MALSVTNTLQWGGLTSAFSAQLTCCWAPLIFSVLVLIGSRWAVWSNLNSSGEALVLITRLFSISWQWNSAGCVNDVQSSIWLEVMELVIPVYCGMTVNVSRQQDFSLWVSDFDSDCWIHHGYFCYSYSESEENREKMDDIHFQSAPCLPWTVHTFRQSLKWRCSFPETTHTVLLFWELSDHDSHFSLVSRSIPHLPYSLQHHSDSLHLRNSHTHICINLWMHPCLYVHVCVFMQN